MKVKLSRSFGNMVVEMGDRSVPAASPFKIEKVVVPIDFSSCSRKALQYAVPFAKQFKAGILFLHVIPFQFPVNDHPMDESLKKTMEQQLAELVKESGVPKEIPVEMAVRFGVEATEIVSGAREANADIIVLSTHGRTGRAHSLVGSVAEDVVRLASCPVLVVRERQREFIRHNKTFTTTLKSA